MCEVFIAFNQTGPASDRETARELFLLLKREGFSACLQQGALEPCSLLLIVSDALTPSLKELKQAFLAQGGKKEHVFCVSRSPHPALGFLSCAEDYSGVLNVLSAALSKAGAGQYPSRREQLRRAEAACNAGDFPKALALYTADTEVYFDRPEGYAGILRAHSKNYTLSGGEQVGRDIALLFALFPAYSDSALRAYLSKRASLEDPARQAAEEKRTADPNGYVNDLYARAQQGDAASQLELANIYYNGSDVVTQSYEDAFLWYGEAAKRGNREAMDRLGDCYRDGIGVKKDPAKALKWYTKASK